MSKAFKHFGRLSDGLWGLAALCFLAPWVASELGVAIPDWALTLGAVSAGLFVLLGLVGFFAFRPSEQRVDEDTKQPHGSLGTEDFNDGK